jgi:hypothetical protein
LQHKNQATLQHNNHAMGKIVLGTYKIMMGKIIMGTYKMMGKIVLGTYKIMMGKIVLGTYKIMMGKIIICKIVGVQSRNKCSLWNVERKE